MIKIIINRRVKPNHGFFSNQPMYIASMGDIKSNERMTAEEAVGELVFVYPEKFNVSINGSTDV